MLCQCRDASRTSPLQGHLTILFYCIICKSTAWLLHCS